jgi:protein MPE1
MLTNTRQQYVAKGGPKKPANVPDHDPPQGYICYRCGEKGHWIQLCPTNENPEYDNRPRVKRTTGIPRSFLKTVDKATALGQHADGDDSKTPSGIMVNADGEFVIAEPDKASWEQFQAKTKANPAAQKAAAEEGKEVRERGLECPADKKMFIEPMKTPCCEKTYCNDCITNALIESDFVCPACKTEGVLIDDLKTDEEAVEKIKTFLAEKDVKKEGSKSPVAAGSPAATGGDGADNKADADKAKSKSPSPAPSAPATTQPGQTSTSTPQSVSSTPATGDQQTQVSKKRPADDALENPKIPKAPKAMQKAQEVQQNNMMPMMNGMPAMGGMPGMPGMPAMGGMPMMFPGMPMMGGNFGPMGGMPNMNMGMMNPMMNPMMAGPMGGGYGGMNNMAGPGGFNGGWGGPGGDNMGMNNNMNAGPGAGGRMNGGMGMGGGYGGGGAHHHQQQQQQQHHQQHQQHQQGQGQGHQQHFQQQQQQQHHNNKNFSYQPADEEDAYFRKPVNPHRHQNRQRRVRPSDYREL